MTLKATDDVTAVGHCEFCEQQWQMSGPAMEVATFLRKQMIAHLHEIHPDKVAEVEAEWAHNQTAPPQEN